VKSYRVDSYTDDGRRQAVSHYQAADSAAALDAARRRVADDGHDYADVYEAAELGRAYYVDTVHGDLGGAR
jgi:hypothetical protein